MLTYCGAKAVIRDKMGFSLDLASHRGIHTQLRALALKQFYLITFIDLLRLRYNKERVIHGGGVVALLQQRLI